MTASTYIGLTPIIMETDIQAQIVIPMMIIDSIALVTSCVPECTGFRAVADNYPVEVSDPV